MKKKGPPELHELVGFIYEAGMDPAKWNHAIEQLYARFRMIAGGMFAHEVEKSGMEVSLVVNIDPHLLKLFNDHYVSQSPIARYLVTQPVGTVCAVNFIMPESEIGKGEFFNDFVAPQGMYYYGGALLAKNKNRIARISFERRKKDGAFTAQELEELTLLGPHFSRAFQISSQFSAQAALSSTLTGLLDGLEFAVFLINSEGKVALHNRQADELLTQGLSLKVKDGALLLPSPATTAELGRLIQECVRTSKGEGLHAGTAMALEMEGVERPLRVLVMPFNTRNSPWDFQQGQICAGVFVASLTHWRSLGTEVLTKWFGLTLAEARLAERMVDGTKLEEIADEFSLSYATVRTQAKTIYVKLGVHRHAELVKVLLSTPARLANSVANSAALRKTR